MRISDWSSDVCSSDLMRLTGRSEEQLALTEAYAKEQGFWLDTAAADPLFTDALELDMGTVQPSLAGPKRPQDKVVLSQVDEVFNADLTNVYKKALPERVPVEGRSEEHTSELQSLMRISYAVFCLKKKKTNKQI